MKNREIIGMNKDYDVVILRVGDNKQENYLSRKKDLRISDNFRLLEVLFHYFTLDLVDTDQNNKEVVYISRDGEMIRKSRTY